MGGIPTESKSYWPAISAIKRIVTTPEINGWSGVQPQINGPLREITASEVDIKALFVGVRDIAVTAIREDRFIGPHLVRAVRVDEVETREGSSAPSVRRFLRVQIGFIDVVRPSVRG